MYKIIDALIEYMHNCLLILCFSVSFVAFVVAPIYGLVYFVHYIAETVT